MDARSVTRLSLALALALAGACGEENPATKDIDPVGEGDDDQSGDDEPTDEEDPEPTDEDDDSTAAPIDSSTPRVDASRGTVDATAAKDAGAGDATAARDTGTTPAGDSGSAPPMPGEKGMCCDDGNCLCHGPAPTALTSTKGPFKTQSYTVAGTGCVYYPTDAEPPFAAVSISDGFLGSGGCGSFQTGQWGPLYASWGIVAMIVNTGSSDQPNARGRALLKGISAFKTENTKAGSPLNGKLAGRYGTSGFSMGGGGTTFASSEDKTLLSSVAIMPWGPVRGSVSVPTLIICGSSDGTAACGSHGTPFYRGVANTTPKMRVQVTSGHAGQPSAGSGRSGQYGLAFTKVFLEGDTRWKSLLVAAPSEETNLK